MRGNLMEECLSHLRRLQRLLAAPLSPAWVIICFKACNRPRLRSVYYCSSKTKPETREPASWVATSLSRPATRARGTRAATEPGKLRRCLDRLERQHPKVKPPVLYLPTFLTSSCHYVEESMCRSDALFLLLALMPAHCLKKSEQIEL